MGKETQRTTEVSRRRTVKNPIVVYTMVGFNTPGYVFFSSSILSKHTAPVTPQVEPPEIFRRNASVDRLALSTIQDFECRANRVWEIVFTRGYIPLGTTVFSGPSRY